MVDPAHPLGCHRRRIPDRVVFEHVVNALVHGSGYERIATAGCSDRTIRRRLRTWAEAGLAETLHRLALEQDDPMIGLELGDLAVDGALMMVVEVGHDRGGGYNRYNPPLPFPTRLTQSHLDMASTSSHPTSRGTLDVLLVAADVPL